MSVHYRTLVVEKFYNAHSECARWRSNPHCTELKAVASANWATSAYLLTN